MNRCAICGRITHARICPVCGQDGPRFEPDLLDQRRRSPRTVRRATAPGPSASTSSLVSTPGGAWAPEPPADARLQFPATAGPVPEPTPTTRSPRTGAASGGHVVSTPTSSDGGPGPDALVRAALVPLLVLVVVTAPGFLGAVVLWLVVALVVVWVLQRLGLSGILSLLSVVSIFRRRRAPAPAWQPPTLTFRWQVGGRIRQVRLRGHDSGLQLGDEAEVQGLPVRGGIHALRVVNRTTGAVLRRHGIGRLVTFGVLDACLLVVLLDRFVG